MTPSTPRLLAVWVPDWPVVALGLEAGGRSRPGAPAGREDVPDPALSPVAIVDGRGVIAASAPARAAGVTAGMRVRVARALCPALAAIPSRPDREARGLLEVLSDRKSVV